MNVPNCRFKLFVYCYKRKEDAVHLNASFVCSWLTLGLWVQKGEPTLLRSQLGKAQLFFSHVSQVILP